MAEVAAAMRKLGILILLAPLAASFADTSKTGKRGPHHAADTFTFVRVEFDSIGGYGESWYSYDGRDWERWETDYPEAEENFLIRIQQLSTIKVNPKPISLRLTDERIFEYPFLYMCDPGWQLLSDAEVESLRSYLQRGGFMWIDDFWGDAEWMNVEEQMERVMPGHKWRRIPKGHALLNIVFPLEDCPQVPAKIFWDNWRETFDMPDGHREPTGGIQGVRQQNCLGLFDENDRLMVLATHNNDIGDGWERESENQEYFEVFSTKSFAMGVNIVAYALTR